VKQQPTPPPPSPLPSTAGPTLTSKKPSRTTRRKKNAYLSKPRVLYVGDSIAHNVAIKHIEQKTETRITTRKGYSSVCDKRARFPNSNMKDITEKAMDAAHSDDQYEYIILSAPTVDITNLDTSKLQPPDDTESLKDAVKTSCKNIMNIAENVLRSKPVAKVVILEHPPRFDTKDKDPLSLKPELAKYANGLYRQFWFASDLKNKIVIGQHNLECSEQSRMSRFTDRIKNKYDGVHMYGPEGRKAFTDSILSIFSSCIDPHGLRPRPSHTDCPQTKYMNKQKARSDSTSSVPVQNRFSVLGN
jgi:hypothetical protein